MAVTYYVALPFVLNDEGVLVASDAKEEATANAAVLAAARMAIDAPGAVAFSRTGDPNLGVYGDAVVIQSFGKVPSMDQLLQYA